MILSQARRFATRNIALSMSSRAITYSAVAAAAALAGSLYYSSKANCDTVLNMSDWRPLEISSIKQTSHNTRLFTFTFPNSQDDLGLKVNGAILAQGHTPNGEIVIRPYTPVSDHDQKGSMELLIKHYPGGPMTDYLFSLKEGDKVNFKGVLQKDVWTNNKVETIYMFAGGTGITPMYQLIKKVLRDPKEKTRIILVDCNNSSDDILLKESLAKLEQNHPNQFN